MESTNTLVSVNLALLESVVRQVCIFLSCTALNFSIYSYTHFNLLDWIVVMKTIEKYFAISVSLEGGKFSGVYVKRTPCDK